MCVSDELAARIAGGGRTVVIPNGLDAEDWRQPPPAPAAFHRLARPIVTCTGTIDDRLDTDLIAKVADDPAVGSVALIGHCEDAVLERKFQSMPKVALCRWMARRDLTGALAASDACLIPHVVSPRTRAMSPLKLYDYLAAGKPVATTVLQPVKGTSERVISASPEDFVAAVRTALELPRQDEKRQTRILEC